MSPNVLHPYIKQVHNVKDNGHCGFLGITYCLGLHNGPKIELI